MSTDSDRELKNLLRKEILETRSCLSKEERNRKNSDICSKLLEMPEFIRAGTVMAYMEFRDEAGTEGIIAECYKRGKRVVLPVVSCTDGARELQVYEIGPGAGFRRNRYGISEPDPKTAKRMEETGIDLVLVPGVVFDLMKHRIGYGAGYYDRFLTRLKSGCATVGIAYELQIVKRIPAENHDIPLNMVITEQRVII